MARSPLTPAKAQLTARGHVEAMEAAIREALEVLDYGSGALDAERMATAAKVLEAGGCYLRRQQAKGLLVPE